VSTCHGCGGVVGRDCYNPVECEMIAREMQHQHDEATALTPEEASTLASLRAGEMVAVRKDAVLALTDCVDCLTLFADEGISMTPESFNSDPQDVLCRLMKAVGVPESGEWGDCAAFVRDLAAAQPRRDEDTPDAPR